MNCRRFFTAMALTVSVVAGVVSACAPRGGRVIENPRWIAANTRGFDITRITLTDTATLVAMDAYHDPNRWIRWDTTTYLAGGGKKYMITGADGIELTAEHYGPRTGLDSFVLYFEPIDPSLKAIDLIEGEPANYFKIWGIDLRGGRSVEKLKEQIPAAVRAIDYTNAKLPEPEFKSGMSSLRLKALGYTPEMEWDPELSVMSMIPLPKDSYLPTEVAPGEWLFEMPLMGPTMARLTMSSMTGIMDIMLEPGADNTVWVDQAAWANQVAPGDPKETWAWFDGRYAAFNMVYVNEFMPYNNDSPVKQYDVSSNVPMLRGMVGKPKEELFPMMKAKRDEILATVDTLSSFSATAREVLKYQIAAGYIGEIGQLGFSIAYQQIMDDESLERSNEKLRELMPVFTPEDYRVAYEGVDFNDPYLFYGMWYYRAYNGLDSQVREAAGMDGTRIGNYVTIAEKIGLDGQAPTIDPADPTAEKRKTEWDKFMQPVNERFAAITDPFFTEALALREQWTAKLREAAANAVGVVVNEAPAELDPFEKIIAKYKGKPVLVDLWATWCGPCLNAMKQQRALKEELMEEGVVFVYITGVTSPKGTWETMIPDIKGEHYYLTGEQWSELDRKFDVDGIPFYIMVQRDGSWKADTNMRLLNVWESTIRAAIDKK